MLENRRNVYDIFYRKEINLHRTYPQNYRRDIGCKRCVGIDRMREIIAEIGRENVEDVYDGCGCKVAWESDNV